MGKCILVTKTGRARRVLRGVVKLVHRAGKSSEKYLIDTKITTAKGGQQRFETHSFGPGTEVARLPADYFETGPERIDPDTSKPAL